MKICNVLKARKVLSITALVFIIFSPNIIFPLFSFLGFNYESGVDTWIYILILSSFAVVAISGYVTNAIKKSTYLIDYYFFSLLVVIVISHICYYLSSSNELINNDFVFFLLSPVPAMLGALIVIHGHYSTFIASVRLYALIIGGGGGIFILVPYFFDGNNRLSDGGMNYQVWSYLGALIFGISTYEFFVVKEKNYRWVWLVLIPVSLLITIIGAGRGAFLVVIAYIVKNIFFTSFQTYRVLVFRFFLFIILFFSVLNFTDNSEVIDRSLNRIFSYISADGSIDLAEGSSGRDVVYKVAIEGIERKPIIGYGPFYVAQDVILPHNILLSLLLQYGIFGLIFFITVLMLLFINFIKYRNDSYWAYSLNLIIMPSIMLLVSGFYILNSLFMSCLLLLLWHRKHPQLEIGFK